MPETTTKETARALLPPRPTDGHKGTFGHVLLLGGSRAYVGAPKLMSGAAERSGAGLVTLGVPASVWPFVAPGLECCIGMALPETDSGTLSIAALKPALEKANQVTAAVLGPGLGRHPETTRFVSEWLRLSPVPTVLDADAINALSEDTAVLSSAKSPVLLTPHPGEMARLLGTTVANLKDTRETLAMAFADLYRVVLVLKGHETIIAAPGGRYCTNGSGGHGLAKGGTGDVLAGLLGGLLAQGMGTYDAARLGCYLHGFAGDIATENLTARGMTAADVCLALCAAWKELERGDEIH